MTSLSSRCPDPEVIAAFVAGNLSGPELTMIANHLRICADCRDVTRTAAQIDREDSAPAIEPRRRPARRRWWVPAAAAAAAVICLAYLLLGSRKDANHAIGQLVAASPRDARYLEPRLTGGFRWAPLKSLRGDSPLDPDRMTLIGAAGAVLRETENDTSAEGRHAAAMAHLLAGDARQADDVLSRTATNARMWSDLAAARYTEAVQTSDPAWLTEALAAADAALRLDANLPEALFNRALIVERLGLRDPARAAWERYLRADRTTPWAREAREHLRSLGAAGDFRRELQQRYAALQRHPAAARELAQRYPQEARLWGETEILARWADAFINGDAAAANAHLDVARAFGESIAQHGELLLLRAVETIERAGHEQRLQLANAHLRFRLAQRTFRDGKPAAAETLFAATRRDFENAGSPAALLATYFLANTIYDQGRLAESRAILDQLRSRGTPEYRAHSAQVQWQLGLAEATEGRWGNAIGAFKQSVAGFEQLGEHGYANRVRDLLAELYDRLGESRIAWTYRMTALRELGRNDPQRLRAALHEAARSAALNREWSVTASLLGLQLELPAGGDDLLYAETLLDHARIEGRLGHRATASADLQRARAVIRRITDTSFRARAEADHLAIAAILEGDPAKAVPALTRAIDFHRQRGRHMFLPELLLERGKALASLGKRDEAAQDFDRGLTELRTQHDSIGSANIGWGTFAVGDELYEAAIDLAVRRGDAAAAFAYAEQSRARSGESQTAPASAARVDGVTVEYATLPDRLLIFVVNGDRVRVAERVVPRGELIARIERLDGTATDGNTAEFRHASSEVYETLVKPVENEIAAAATVAFVPDAALGAVPFGALLDERGEYVIAKHAVVTAPSRAWYLRATGRQAGNRERLLLIEGSPTTQAGSLWSGRREATAVAGCYPSVDVVTPQSDRADFLRRAEHADVIHFVGHGVIPDASDDAALVTSGEDGAAGQLEATDIAAMHFPHTRVVVLAACGTARDHRLPGQTSISVARAFLAAGVPAVVATLWPIDDGLATEFFPSLHARLARGDAPAEALRATQLEWIHRADASPRMWAAVQLIGI